MCCAASHTHTKTETEKTKCVVKKVISISDEKVNLILTGYVVSEVLKKSKYKTDWIRIKCWEKANL